MSYGGTWMLCGYCGRPVAIGVSVGGGIFHEECTRGPNWQPPTYQPPTLGEEQIRRIVREELERKKP